MTAAPGTDPLGTTPLFDVKIPLTPARAAAARRALAALDAIPAQRRELDLREHQLITGARTAGATWQQIAARLGYKDRQAAQQATRHSHAPTSSHRHGRVRDSSDLRKRSENSFEPQITLDALRAVHLGGRLDDGVIRWSGDTQRRHLDLIAAQARDAVITFLDTSYVEKKLAEMSQTADRPVADPQAVVEIVCQRLRFTAEQQQTILTHFTRGGDLTAGGVMHAVTSAAQTLADADAAHEMEAQALPALDLAAHV